MTRIGRHRNTRPLSGVGASAVFACVGGILDAFTDFGHGRVFANSMTGNVVLLGVDVMQKDWHQASRHLFPICSFFVGISAARTFFVHFLSGSIQNPDLAVLTIEIALLGAIGCLPDASSDFLITTTMAFAASLQSEAFRSAEGFPFNSTFTTGNLRTLSESVFDFLFDNSQPGARRMVRIFSVICSIVPFRGNYRRLHDAEAAQQDAVDRQPHAGISLGAADSNNACCPPRVSRDDMSPSLRATRANYNHD
jgi:uncharacterized membrane protein YoaK (UPF0700 family)